VGGGGGGGVGGWVWVLSKVMSLGEMRSYQGDSKA
jgi:hypothetical protein